MKIVITGSLGNIGKPLTETLVGKGYSVTVISSNPEKQKEIENLGANAAIRSIEDVSFLSNTFADADVVYVMVPPDFKEPNRRIFYSRIANNYAEAIQQAKVKRVIHLSTFGADLDKGTGILMGAHDAENILNKLENVVLTHIRPTYFFYNLNNFIPAIKYQNSIKANYGGDRKFPLVSPLDIAEAIADEITNPNPKGGVRYVYSDERNGHEIAKILGEAIGKPDLKWEVISNEEVQNNLEGHGVPLILAQGLTEMYDSMYKGDLASDFYKNKPNLGNVKLEDFAKDFAVTYNETTN
jgi:uncharacterized protein YbjT (DUF2867 family)